MTKTRKTTISPERLIAAGLTKAERLVLIAAGEFLLAGEWGETINESEEISLGRALEKLRRTLER